MIVIMIAFTGNVADSNEKLGNVLAYGFSKDMFVHTIEIMRMLLI